MSKLKIALLRWPDLMEMEPAKKKQASELSKLQDFFPPGARDVTASPLGRGPDRRAPGSSPQRPKQLEQDIAEGTVQMVRALAPAVDDRNTATARPNSTPSSATPAVGSRRAVASTAQLEACKAKLLHVVAAHSSGRSSVATLVGDVYADLVEDFILDVAFEAHRRPRHHPVLRSTPPDTPSSAPATLILTFPGVSRTTKGPNSARPFQERPCSGAGQKT